MAPTGEAPEPRPCVAAPLPKPTGLDNTVGPVPKISGYVFNTLQTNSAAHVPNTNVNLINEDTHICDLNLYETIFQNVCLIDSLSAMTPDTNNHGVALPTVISHSRTPKKPLFTGSNSELSNEKELPSNKDCRPHSKSYSFT